MESSDSAWERFKQDAQTESVQKASLADKLDILASQLNEVVTNTRNVAKLAPEIMGDQSAIDAANAMAPPGDMGGGMDTPDAGGLPDPSALADELSAQMGGDEMMNPDEMVDEGTAPDMPVPEEPSPEAGAPAPDMPVPEAPMPGVPAPEAPVPETPVEAMPEAPTEMPMPEAPMDNILDMYNSDVAFEDLIMTLTDELHEAIDAGDLTKVKVLTEKLEALKSVWSGLSGTPLAGAEDMVPPEMMDAVPVEGAAPELPPEALMKAEKEDDADEEGEDEDEVEAEDDVVEAPPAPEAEVIEAELNETPQEEMVPQVDPMVQGLMELMAMLDAGAVDDAKAMIAELIQANTPIAKSEEEMDVSAGSGDLGEGDSEPVALSEDSAPMVDTEDAPVEKGCDDEPVVKSEQFHIESITEMMARMNGYSRPASDSAVGGNIMRPSPSPYAIRKSAVNANLCDNPLAGSTDADWERYKAYKAQGSF